MNRVGCLSHVTEHLSLSDCGRLRRHIIASSSLPSHLVRTIVKKKSFAVVFLAIAGWLGGCGGAPEITPEMAARDAELSEEVATVKKQQDQFATDAEALIKDIQVLRGQPGWSEVAPVLKSSRNSPNQATALKAWGEKWKQSPDTISQRFQQLVERSSAIEKRRKELLTRWANLKAKDDELFRKSGRWTSKNIDQVVGHQTLTYDVNRLSLNRYGVDEFGLFRDIHAQAAGP